MRSVGILRFLFGSLCVLGVLLAGCARQTASTSSVVRLSQRNEPADLDPATATLPDEFFIIRALGEGLFVPDPAGGSPLPAAAERCDVSPDGLVHTFHLRPVAHWSNGDPVTADDFIASYRRLLSPATAAPKADLFYAVKNARAFATGTINDFSAVGFRATDARTLVVTLAQPTARFLHYAASGPWIPVHPRTVARHGRQWTQPTNHVGNGPFTLAEWRPQQRIVVKKSPLYRDATHVTIDALEFLRFDSGDTEERAYRAGQVDVTMAVPFTKIETYQRERPAEIRRSPLAEIRYLTFNTQRPPLDDPHLRRALGLAIDRQTIVARVTRGGQEPAFRFLAPVLRSGVLTAPLAAEFRFDPAEARRLLAAAGFAGGRNFPRLELTSWSPSHTPVLEAIQAVWRQELGIEVAISIHEAKVHQAALRSGDYTVAFITTIPDVADPAAVLENFSTGAANNYPHLSSADYDRLLATAATQRDESVRNRTLAAAENLLLESAVVAPLYFNTKNWLMAPGVRGWQEDALWTRFYPGLSIAGR